jgi:hypothetical protein
MTIIVMKICNMTISVVTINIMTISIFTLMTISMFTLSIMTLRILALTHKNTMLYEANYRSLHKICYAEKKCSDKSINPIHNAEY